MAKVVWVLGAGFSVPLGGPTLATLLSKAGGEDLRLCFPNCAKVRGGDTEWTRHLYHYGRRFHEGYFHHGLPDGESLWSDPEAFLDYLDTAVVSGAASPAWQRVTQVLTNIVQAYSLSNKAPAVDAVRAIAVDSWPPSAVASCMAWT